MREVVIVEAVRTPLIRKNTYFSNVNPVELAAHVLREVVNRTNIPPEVIDDVIMGCVTQFGEQAGNIGRQATLTAGLPIEIPGVTIDRQCGSSQQAVHFASQAIMSGDMDVIIAAGVESMTRVPMFSNYTKTAKLEDFKYSEELTSKYEMLHQGLSAERISEKWNLSRSELDEFSYESHFRALQAQNEGRFEKEIVPINVVNSNGEQMLVDKDNGPREDTSLEKISKLQPVFVENGTIHAGNASQICDGASAVLLMSREKAEYYGLKPRFRIVARSVVGSDPTLALTGPIPATKKVLKTANLTIEDIDLYEVNEAFANIPIIWMKETGADHNKLNVNGGAVALGHPLGATGARLLTTLMHELERIEGRYGLVSICEGYGTANATIIERIK